MKRARGGDSKNSVSKRITKTRRPADKPTPEKVKSTAAASDTDKTRAYFEQKRKAKKKAKKAVFLKRAIAILALVLTIAIIVLLGIGSGMYAAIANEVDELDFESMAYNFTSIIYADDEEGNSSEVTYLHQEGNREWINTDEIPQIAKDAAISIEDERFMKHGGVDLKRTTGAIFGWAMSKITGKEPGYGGSTITQQVMKNITNEKDRTVTRKVKEIMRAIALEHRFTKEEILTTYLNISYFGNQCYGLEAAAKMYFSKNAMELTLPEAAMIVGITQAPSRFDPFTNPENTMNKRNTVLKKMYELEKISEEEYQEAINSPLGVNDSRGTLNSVIYNYFIDEVINDIVEDLQEQKGYSKSFATNQVFNGGLKIYTTMDVEVQKAMEKVFENKSNFPGASSGVQSAMVVIDPKTGQIKGIVGGIGKKDESRGFNRATQARRQPGSSIKPISVYAPALEYGKITAATIITDSPITIEGWTPKNAYKGNKGDMSVRHALKISANVPAVKTLETLGEGKSYEFLTRKLGFTYLEPIERNPSALGLGGMQNGVSPKEMAAAYAMFANKGEYITPHTYTKVLDNSGKVLLEKKPEKKRALSEANAFIMTTFLKDAVNASGGTGGRARLAKTTAYGKTGTSNDDNDKWFCGYTTEYAGAVWYGYDSKKSVGSSNIAASVWKKVMDKIHEGKPSGKFEKPDSVTAVSVCQLTGKLSAAGCGRGETEYFAKGTVPTKYCNGDHSGVVGPKGTEPPATPTPEESPNPEVSGDPEATIDPNAPVVDPGTEQTPPPEQTQAPEQTPPPEQTPAPTPPPAENQGDSGVITIE